MDVRLRVLFTHDADGRMLLVNEPDGGGPAPWFFLGRTREGNVWRFRADLPQSVVRKLEEVCREEPVVEDLSRPPRYFAEYARLLEPVRDVWMGPAYRFTDDPEPSRPAISVNEENAEMLRGGFEKLIDELPAWQPFLVIAEGGRAVSVCRSVRLTADAHEAGIETLPEFRGRGYAPDVVAGWANAVRSLGAIPLYSTSWDNDASQAVAKKLRLVLYGADFHIA